MPLIPPAIGMDAGVSDVSVFRALLGAAGGPGSQSRFFVMVTPPAGLGAGLENFSDMRYLCESADLPGKGLKTAELRHYGPSFRRPYEVEYETIDLTFLCRDYYTERFAYDAWMELISPTNNYDMAYPDDYEGSVRIYTVTQTSMLSRYRFNLQGAFPIMVSKQPMSWIEDQVQRLTVTFSYAQWTRDAAGGAAF